MEEETKVKNSNNYKNEKKENKINFFEEKGKETNFKRKLPVFSSSVFPPKKSARSSD